MSALARLRAAVDAALKWTVVALMALMVVNVLWQVATRFLFQAPSSYTEELARYLLIWGSLLGAAYAAGQRLHLAVDLVPALRGGPAPRWMSLFVQAAVITFSVLILIVGGLRLVWITLALDQTSAALRVPLGYVYLVVPLSGVLITFYAVMALAEDSARPAGTPTGPAAGPALAPGAGDAGAAR